MGWIQWDEFQCTSSEDRGWSLFTDVFICHLRKTVCHILCLEVDLNGTPIDDCLWGLWQGEAMCWKIRVISSLVCLIFILSENEIGILKKPLTAEACNAGLVWAQILSALWRLGTHTMVVVPCSSWVKQLCQAISLALLVATLLFHSFYPSV